MARKRGGIAGFYDRNKKIIKTVAPIAAGFIPVVGPAIGAGIGAALGGDTEGKGYFKGFNTGGAIQGGLSGYGGAKLGQSAKGGLGKLFTGGMSPVEKLTGAPQVGLTPSVPNVTGIGSKYVTPMPVPNVVGGGGGGMSLNSLGGLFGKEGVINQNLPLIQGVGKGIMGERAGARADEQAELNRAEDTRQFDATLAQRKAEADFTGRRLTIEEAEEAERKRVAAATLANREKYRAMFTGGATA
jgi:hypothetical protein